MRKIIFAITVILMVIFISSCTNNHLLQPQENNKWPDEELKNTIETETGQTTPKEETCEETKKTDYETNTVTKESNEEIIVIEKIFTSRENQESESLREANTAAEEVNSITCEKDHLMIVLVFGQSQSANYGETLYKSKKDVFSFYKGKFYKAEDPLLGADGNRGSVWTRLGDKIIESQLYDTIIFVPIGAEGSVIEKWTPDGDLYYRIIEAIDGLRQYNLEITHLFWHQGSADSWQHSPDYAEQYKNNFNLMINSSRNYGVSAPIYVCISTYSYGNSDTFIQQAQKDLVDTDAEIYPGPDTDNIDVSYRFDGVHFSDAGLEELANLWLEKLENHGN